MFPRQERGTQEQFLDPYIKQLGLRWKVATAVEEGLDRPSISSSKREQIHRIAFPLVHVQNMEELRCDFAHELIHGKLAESIDPIFSGIRFHPSYDIHDPTFQQQARMVYFAQMPIEVWVSDYMAKLDPKLAEEDVKTWLESILTIPGPQLKHMAQETTVAFGVNAADIKRHKITGLNTQEQRALKKIRTFLGQNAHDSANQLARFFTTLPQLSVNPNQAIPLLERSTQQTARILRFPIKPTLTQVGEDWVWKVTE